MKISITILLSFVMLLILADFVVAQVPAPLLPGNPDQAPIDGGITLLAAAGGAYAWKKLRRKV